MRVTQNRLKLILFAAIAWFGMVSVASAQDANTPDRDVHGAAEFRSDYFWVDQDKGRFREDQWRPDAMSGGLERLDLSSQAPDENVYEWRLQGRALYEHD